MLDFIKGIKKFSVATMIVATVVGLLFLIFPNECIKYTALVVGISLIVTGVIAIVTYIVKRDGVIAPILGSIVAVCGIIICIKYKAIIDIIIVLFGIFILISGLVDLATSIRSLTFHRPSGWFTLMLSIITIIFGVVAITNSNELSTGIVRFIGVSLIIYAVLDLITLIQISNIKRNVKKRAQALNDIPVDATVIDDDEIIVDAHLED